jgi:hypothetical protein
MAFLANTVCRLIGFSIRVPEDQVANSWDNDRRRTHLLNPHVKHPLSIDDAVWPFPADVDNFLAQNGDGSLGEVDANPLNLMPAIPIGWVTQGLPREVKSRYRLIAATIGDSDYAELNKVYKAIINSSSEEMVAAVISEWVDLGLDVMDQTAISGLTNCGLGDAVGPDQRRNLQDKLNENGLVIDEIPAREIVMMLDKLAPEHAPFLPVRLWKAPR